MSLSVVLHVLGTIPLFASRAFLPAFLTALLFRFPDYVPGLSIDAPEVNTFITQTPVVIILGVLAALEILADKSTTIKSFWVEVTPYLKPLIYVLMMFNVVDNDSEAVLQGIYQASVGEYTLILISAASVYGLTLLRKTIEEWLLEIDSDGDLYLNFIFSSIEDVFVFFGFLLLLVSGTGALIFFGLVLLMLYVWQKRIKKNEERQKVNCPNCQTNISPFALICYKCQTEQKLVYEIGLFGQKKEKMISSREKHSYALLSQERCAYCADRNSKIECPNCKNQHLLLSSKKRASYLNIAQKRYLIWLLLSALLGFIPVIGIGVGVLGANIYVFAPLKRQLPLVSAIQVKVLTKLLLFIVIFLGSLAGFILAPIYCTIRFFMWRRGFVKYWNSKGVISA